MPPPIRRTATQAASVLADRVRSRRAELEVTQQQVAYEAGITISWLSDIERAKRQRPELPGLLALAEALDMDAGELLGGLKPDPKTVG